MRDPSLFTTTFSNNTIEQLQTLANDSPCPVFWRDFENEKKLSNTTAFDMAQSGPHPGILLLASRILDDSAALTGLDIARWGEETCIPSVQATGGITHTLRYESVRFMKQHRSTGRGATSAVEDPQLENARSPYDFLDVYFMPDIDAKDSEAFRQLPIIGDPEITADVDASKLLERLLMQTEFEINFCAALESEKTSAAPAPFLITVALRRGQALPEGLSAAGKVMGRYRVQDGAIFSALERSPLPAASPNEIVLLACNSLKNVSVPEQSGAEHSPQIGILGLRKQFTGAETQPAAWRPGVRI